MYDNSLIESIRPKYLNNTSTYQLTATIIRCSLMRKTIFRSSETTHFSVSVPSSSPCDINETRACITPYVVTSFSSLPYLNRKIARVADQRLFLASWLWHIHEHEDSDLRPILNSQWVIIGLYDIVPVTNLVQRRFQKLTRAHTYVHVHEYWERVSEQVYSLVEVAVCSHLMD